MRRSLCVASALIAISCALVTRADAAVWYWPTYRAERTLEVFQWPDKEVVAADCMGVGDSYQGNYRAFHCKLSAEVIDKAAQVQAREDLATAERIGDPRMIREAVQEVNDAAQPSDPMTLYITMRVTGKDTWTAPGKVTPKYRPKKHAAPPRATKKSAPAPSPKPAAPPTPPKKTPATPTAAPPPEPTVLLARAQDYLHGVLASDFGSAYAAHASGEPLHGCFAWSALMVECKVDWHSDHYTYTGTMSAQFPSLQETVQKSSYMYYLLRTDDLCSGCTKSFSHYP